MDAAIGGGVTHTLAAATATLAYEDLPPAIRELAQRLLLDTVGCALGALHLVEGRRHAAVGALFGSHGSTTLWGSARRAGAAGAAFVNGNLANVLDADETFRNFTHIGAAVVSAALAVAEAHGRSGTDTIAGVVAGYEVSARLGLAMPTLAASKQGGTITIGWSKGGGQGWLALGSAAAAARALGLDARQTAHAFGIAAFAAPQPTLGRWWYTFPMPMTKYLLYGSMAAAGVLGASMAADGITGDATVLDGEGALWNMTGARSFNSTTASTPFGAPWWIARAAFKPYPCTRQIHAALDGVAKTAASARQAGLAPEEATSIEIGVQKAVLGSHYQNRDPNDAPTASFSLPYTAALVTLGIKPGPGWLAPSMMVRSDVREIMGRVHIHEEKRATHRVARQLARLGTAGFDETLATVALFVGGRRFRAEVTLPRGDPESGLQLSSAELDAKFRNYSSGVIQPDVAESFIHDCRVLDRISDVRPLLGSLAV